MLAKWFVGSPRTARPYYSLRAPSSSGFLLCAVRPRTTSALRGNRLISNGARSSSLHMHSSAPSSPAPGLVLSDAQRKTIYALSTPPGKAGVAVIRVSGPDALRVWRSVVRRPAKGRRLAQAGIPSKGDPEPWRMYRCEVIQPETQELLDSGLAVYFKGTPPCLHSGQRQL